MRKLDNPELTDAWKKYNRELTNAQSEIQGIKNLGELSQESKDRIKEVRAKLGSTSEWSMVPKDKTVEEVHTVNSDDIVKAFFIGDSTGNLFKRNLFITLFFSYFDSEYSSGSGSSVAWEKEFLRGMKPPKEVGGYIPTGESFEKTDADSFITSMKVILTVIKIFRGHDTLQEYEGQLLDTIGSFEDNLSGLIGEIAAIEGVTEELTDVDTKRDIMGLIVDADEDYKGKLGEFYSNQLGTKDDMEQLNNTLDRNFKPLKETVLTMFYEMVEQVGSGELESPKKQRVKFQESKVTIKEKLKGLGLLSSEGEE